ncbi:MAG: InlB B-repeat-containing protein, partial [Peptococcaceae bacterium]|nr:InlB B-repeat-containing protein [Peptococcaceae bacterium]
MPITVSGLEPGYDYSFALLRGLKTNNNICLVLAQDQLGYLSFSGTVPADPFELAWYNEKKYDEYEYRRPNYDFDIVNPVTTGTVTASVQTNDEGSFYPFRFGFTTKTDAFDEYSISFNVTPSSAAIVVKDSAGAEQSPSGDKAYSLPPGEYSYTASATNYSTVTDKRFTVSGDASINILMYGAQLAGTNAQGLDQKLVLVVPNSGSVGAANSGIPLQNVSALRLAANYVTEGYEYFLNRVEDVYDISAGKDVQIQAHFAAGMNNWSPLAWERNGLRYITVISAETGRVVANWRDETPDANGKNSSGAYQIGSALPAGLDSANQGGILFTIPNGAFEYNKSYYMVFGSAVCGNNNGRMLYSPIIFQITTSNSNGGGAVIDQPQPLQINNITVNTIKNINDSVSKVDFVRQTGAVNGYNPGLPILKSIVGQEIALKETTGSGLSVSWQISNEFGSSIPVNYYLGGGGASGDFGDTRFIMPNAAVTVNAVFGYEVEFVYSDGSPVSMADMTVSDNLRDYHGERKVTTASFTDPVSTNTLYNLVYGKEFFVLPAGEYTCKIAGSAPVGFTVSGNDTITVTESASDTLNVKFNVSSSGAELSNLSITVWRSNSDIPSVPLGDGSYELLPGDYFYEVKADRHKSEFYYLTVSNENIVKTIVLNPISGPAVSQGLNQTARLNTLLTTTPHQNVAVLQSVAAFSSGIDGSGYYLNRVEDIYDIRQDVQMQIFMVGGGLNDFQERYFFNNFMRYAMVLNATTGETVANWRWAKDNHEAADALDAEGKNSSGAYQIKYNIVPGYTVGQAGIILTIPKEALKPEASYVVILGSATCGNNNSRMHYVPVSYLITMSDVDGGGVVNTEIKSLVKKGVALNVIRGADDTVSAIAFNRPTNTTGTFAVGAPIASSVPGQEIAIAKTAIADGLSYSLQVATVSGKVVPLNVFYSDEAYLWNDKRFTMPGEAVVVNAIFGYTIYFEDANGNQMTPSKVTNGSRNYLPDYGYFADRCNAYPGSTKDGVHGLTKPPGPDFSVGEYYVLPEGNYTYTAVVDGTEINGDFSVSADATIKVATGTEVYTVTFVDYDDTVINTQTVEKGQDAVAPTSPVREGYTFTGWSAEYSNITANLTVKAQYEAISVSPTTYT